MIASSKMQTAGAPTTEPLARMERIGLMIAMAGTILVVFAFAYWSEQRESTAALEDFAREQSTLADALAADLAEKVRAGGDDASRPVPSLAAMAAVESKGALRVFVRGPRQSAFSTQDGAVVRSDTIERALARGDRWVRLSRDEAKALGLSERTALAGLHRIVLADGATWEVAVAASAERQRDHEIRAARRLTGTVALTSLLVLAFGGIALRTQRRRLELSRELAIAAVRRDRDERLVRADKLATLGAIATGIAHEVSTPLGVILGRADQLLARAPEGDRSRRAIEVILTQTDRINQVIRGFLNLARGNSPRLSHVNPASLARAAVELVQHRFDNARVSLISRVPASLPEVACEPHLFEQVLVNLLLNACDACDPEGTVELIVEGREGHIVFRVLDDGHGISREAADRAIEPFFTTKPVGKGTGLGLAIAHEIVKHHCGRLTIGPGADSGTESSAARAGTVVSVEVPIATVAAAPALPGGEELHART